MPDYRSKDPADILDYTINWAGDLGADTINTSSYTVPTGITKVSDSKTTTTTTVIVSGGTLGQRYYVTATIVSVGVKTFERTLVIEVMEH